MTLRRVFATGLAAAGLYAGLLGPAGALAQDPTPTHDGSPVEQSTPAPATDPLETSTPTPEPSTTPVGSPTPSPEATPEATPTALPDPTPEPTVESTATATPEATADSGTAVGDFTLAVEDDRRGADLRTGSGAHTVAACETGSGRKTKKHRKGSTSTSGRDCPKAEHPREQKDTPSPTHTADGTPTVSNPTYSLASTGPAPIGVPNFFIDKFRIPPFLLSIYQAAGIQYGIRWEILAAINEIETDYGRNLNVSSAGALGWMQFMPATWKAYGVDANKDGVKDPYNPVDAVFAAARYLKAAGADKDLRRGIFAYNHADWYVDSVLLRARVIGGLPSNFVGSLTGLTQARFPVQAKARYAGAVDVSSKRVRKGNAAVPVESDAGRRGISIFAKKGSPVVAVNDGRIVDMGAGKRLGRYIKLQDVYGNVYTYAHLATVAKTYPAPRPRSVTKREITRELKLPKAGPKPTSAASSTSKAAARKVSKGKKAAKRIPAKGTARPAATKQRLAAHAASVEAAAPAAISKDRLFAHPARKASRSAGGELQLAEAGYRPLAGAALKLNRRDYVAKKLRKGARVIGGSILGRIGRTSPKVAPHVLFEIRPAGRGAPRIDPKPILDGWKLLESTEIYRAAGRNPFVGPDAEQPSIGQILLMSKEALQRHVLSNSRIDLYSCGRRDVRLGLVDRRVLATLEFLSASGLKPTVTSLRCGHGVYTASGNVSEHASGNAVDIAAVNGITITPGTQGEGSITEMTIQRLLTLQGTMKPHQIISLMTFDGSDNTYAMGDHGDHIHVGFRPLYASNTKAAKQVNAILKPHQWIKLIDRLGEIDNPVVRRTPSKYALKVKRAKVAAD